MEEFQRPCADLSLSSALYLPDPAKAGRLFFYVAMVHNRGPDPAAGVQLTCTLPISSPLPRHSGKFSACRRLPWYRLLLDDLAPGTGRKITLAGRLSESLLLPAVCSASLSARTADPHLTNNVVTVVIPRSAQFNH